LEHRAFTRRAQRRSLEDYWKSTSGITRRIDSLALFFAYKVVTNAIKIDGEVNEAEWFRWRDMGDARVCEQCLRYASGGRGGYYYKTWFMPAMPVHAGCRCQWEILFEEPRVQTKLP